MRKLCLFPLLKISSRKETKRHHLSRQNLHAADHFMFSFSSSNSQLIYEKACFCRTHAYLSDYAQMYAICPPPLPFQFSCLKKFTIIFYAKQLKLYES